MAGGGDVFRGVSAQAAGGIYGGFGSVGKRAGKAQRDSGGGVVGSGDAGGSVADEFVAGAVEVRAAAFWRGHVYVAATDLLPEVNREPNWRMALLVFVG